MLVTDKRGLSVVKLTAHFTEFVALNAINSTVLDLFAQLQLITKQSFIKCSTSRSLFLFQFVFDDFTGLMKASKGEITHSE